MPVLKSPGLDMYYDVDSELPVVPGNSYHVAATHAGECAGATIDFIERVRALANATAANAAAVTSRASLPDGFLSRADS